VGPYRLESPIGRGGMGTVWKAWDERLGRHVAVKQVLSDAHGSGRERLRREARAAARLNHPAIVHVYDLFEEDEGDWIVMELVQGRTLREQLDQDGPLPVTSVVQLGIEIAEGLAEAHAQGVLHRDLKTSNIMVTPAGRAKILDFGLAKEILETEAGATVDLSLTAPGSVIGTSYAMSPEQVMGLALDARSDLFSLGALLYEALTGSPPFRGEQARESMARVLSLQQPPVRSLRPEAPRELSDLLDRLLEKDPVRRPGRSEDVARRLAQISRIPPGASPDSALARKWPLSRGDVSASSSSRHSQSRERRRLVVVSCGLVQADSGSGERFLDVETLAEAMAELEEVARDAAEPLGGQWGAALGHSFWLYFGYPQAQEDDAQRAVRAAQRLLDRVNEIALDATSGWRKLAVRIAIHSGRAVVAARPGEAPQLQLGATLDLATGLQNLAAPGSIVLSSEAWRLVARSFATESLPPVRLPGFEEPVPLVRVLGALEPRDAESGQEGALVGRQRELDLLLDRFRLCQQGQGQAVMIRGEAGIGKSRMVRALREALAADDPAWLVGYGSPYAQSSPLAPMIDLLERTAFHHGIESPEQKLVALEEMLRLSGLPLAENIPVLASLLDLPAEGRYPPLTITPDVRREKTLEVLVALLAEMAERRPLVLILEDLHWIDPSTLELLDLLLGEISSLPLLLLCTFRPELQPSWKSWAPITQINLNRLADGETEALIDRLAEERGLPPAVRRQIVMRTDGVPLFIEELTKAVLETGWSDEEIPSTLDGSLMARLDRLGLAREVAQLASVIGRAFTFELLSDLSPLDGEELRRGLDELVQVELVHRRGAGARARYVFKHALIQDAAYLSLLKSQRQQIHEKVALALEEGRGGAQEADPEILAHHFERAGLIPRAIPYLQQAALRALQRSAFSEALSHCRKGIELLSTLPASPQIGELELSLRSILGIALIPTRGYASPEVEGNAARSQALCQELGDTPRLIPSLYGLWVYHLLRGNRKSAVDLAEEIGRVARADNEEHVFISFSARGITALYEGELAKAEDLLAQAMARYRPEIQPSLAQTFGDESGLLPHFYHFWCLWLLGRTDDAVRKMEDAMATVRSIPSPYVRVTGYLFEMILWHEMRRTEEVQRVAAEFVALSREQRFPFFLALASCGEGWTWLYRGDPDKAIAQIHEALENHKAIGTRLPRAYWLTYLIEVYLEVGRVQEGLAAVEEALGLSETQLDVFYDAELYRLRGELLLRVPDPVGAEAAFLRALEIARRQGAIALEQRAAASLERLG